MTTTTWATVRHIAIEGFRGELPNATTEQDLIDAFEQEPLAVIHARDQVIDDFAQGKCRSGWAIWRTRVTTVQQARDLVVDISDRPKAIATAEAWIRNAGGYLENESELVAHLFGATELTPPIAYLLQIDRDTKDSRGRHLYGSLLNAAIETTREEGPQEIPATIGLLSRHDDPVLRSRMVELWQAQRPACIQTEREAIERQATQAQALRTLRSRHDKRRAIPHRRDREDEDSAPQSPTPHDSSPSTTGTLEERSDGLAMALPDLAYLETLAPEQEDEAA